VALVIIFSPLSVATRRAPPPRDVLQGSGIYNLFRQTGGSLGIAVIATMIDHRGALHYAHLADSGTPFADATRARVGWGAMGGALAARGLDPTAASDGALALLSGTIHAQAAVLAFRDC